MQWRFTVIWVVFVPLSGLAQEQKDLIDIGQRVTHIRIKRPLKIKGKGVFFSMLPAGSDLSGAGNLLITTTTAAFYAGDSASYLSTITLEPYATLQGRVGFELKSNIWMKANKWDILGDTRFLYYPQYTWGLGGNPASGDRMLIDYKYVRFYRTFLRRIKPYLFAGLGYLLDYQYDMDTQRLLETFTHYKYGTGTSEESISNGLTINFLYDGRKNPLNPLPGCYANIVYRINPIGPTPWHSLYADLRKYIQFSHTRQDMLAFWAYYWTVLGSHAPYLDLPSIGWDPYQQRSGRGFEQSRYRGKGLLYGEGEYRRDITADGLFGFVLFANLNSVTQPVTHQLAYFHPAGGGGLRIKFNKRSNTNVSIDYGASRGYSGLYLNLGETF